MEIEFTCVICKDKQIIKASLADVAKYQNGMKIQDAMPYLTPAQREMFITSYCDKCWDEIFKDCED